MKSGTPCSWFLQRARGSGGDAAGGWSPPRSAKSEWRARGGGMYGVQVLSQTLVLLKRGSFEEN